eukprot:g32688.t1
MLPPHPYGSAAVKASQLEGAFTQRRSLNLVVVFSNLALPWAAFGLVFWALAFWPHFEHPICAWSLLLFHLAIALVSVLAAFRWSSERAAYWPLELQLGIAHRSEISTISGYRYFAGAILVSVLVASLLGSLTYQYTMKDAYTLTQHLKMYKDVDVGQAKGQQMMDAGLVAFETSSGLDLRKSQGSTEVPDDMATTGFRDGGKTYCVAPITNGQGSLPVYDFWAVGVDCCSSIRADFRCGQYDQPRAHAGIRWLSAGLGAKISVDNKADLGGKDHMHELLARMVLCAPETWFEVITGKPCPADAKNDFSIIGVAFDSSSRLRRAGVEYYHDRWSKKNEGYLYVGSLETPKVEQVRDLAPKKEGLVRMVAISDTHLLHENLPLPEGDLLVHAGDLSYEELLNMSTWAGPERAQMLCEDFGVKYLHTEAAPLSLSFPSGRKVKIWGSGVSFFAALGKDRAVISGNIAYQLDTATEEDKFVKENPSHDWIVVCPGDQPKWINDLLKRVKPQVYLCGHAHNPEKVKLEQKVADVEGTLGAHIASTSVWNAYMGLPFICDLPEWK